METYRPYSVLTPPFDPVSGGIRVMWGLYGWLLAKGQIVYANAQYEDKNFVAIYPEIYHGNQAGADVVVRYILNKPGVMATGGVPGPTTFSPNDKIYVFSQLFNTMNVHSSKVLFLPILNLHVFKDLKRKRNKTAVFFGKGKDKGLHPKSAITIDKNVAQKQHLLAELLNECECLYSYDSVSAMFEIARLCGCRVCILPNGDYTKDEFSKYEPGMNGISWTRDEKVRLDTKGFKKHYVWLRREFSRKLEMFIQDTQR